MLNRIREGLRRFMTGRHGVDQLSTALIYAALLLEIIYMFTHLYALSLISTILIVFSIFRMLSRNGGQRYAENQRFLAFFSKISTSFRQWKTRRANSKDFTYFRCPKCHAMLRMPKGIGEKTVTCGSCGHQFRKKG